MTLEPRPSRVGLSVAEAVALGLAYGGWTGQTIGDCIPERVWDSLFERGLLALSFDFTGEATTVTTEAGQFALALACKADTA